VRGQARTVVALWLIGQALPLLRLARRYDAPSHVWLWPPARGFGHGDQAHLFWRAMLPVPYLWLILAGRDLRR
jgi:hypothetical protein